MYQDKQEAERMESLSSELTEYVKTHKDNDYLDLTELCLTTEQIEHISDRVSKTQSDIRHHDSNYMKEYRELWKDIVETDEEIDIDKVARELSDFSVMMDEVSKVYYHITQGRLSKPYTKSDSVIAVYERVVEKIVDDSNAD